MTEHHDDDGDSMVLTDDDRTHITEEIASILAELLTVTELTVIRELGRRQRHLADELQAGHRLQMDENHERFDHEIIPRAAQLGGGWRLYLIADDIEVGGGVFPASPDASAAESRWVALDREQRLHWTTKGLSDASGNAYLAYLTDQAWHDASQAAGEWLDSRPAD